MMTECKCPVISGSHRHTAAGAMQPVLFRLALGSFFLAAVRANAGNDARGALWAAVRDGDAKAVKAQLATGTNVNVKNEIGVTALWIAASKGKLEVVETLLEHGADVNARDGIWYQTPLSLSLGGFIGGSNLKITKRLLKAGAKDVDNAAITGRRPRQRDAVATDCRNRPGESRGA
ncbi:MAG: ankyrin repeat domain-containing protein [Planctomycetes bacterium]|nr:ankyrin repeat domain-containing protein [Planctomycetota bacterium]